MIRWKLSVAALATFGVLLLNGSAQTPQSNQPPATNQSRPSSPDPNDQQQATPAPQSAPASTPAATTPDTPPAQDPSAASQDTSSQDNSSSNKKAKKEKPKTDEQKRKDPDTIGDRGVGNGVNFYSLDKEIALGKQLAQEVERQAKVVDDPIIAEYVNRVGQNLVRNSDAKVPFTIKVLDTEEVNAFALPGGFFFVNSGLILKAESEAELAGVMAHEIAHVACRHGTRQATKGDLAQIATIPLIFMGGWTGYAIRQGLGLAIPMGFLAFSRGMEAEADYFGLQYMYKAGYDPTAFVDFFEKIETLEKKKPGSVSKVFATHPMTDDRIKKSQDEIQTILVPKPEYVVNTSEFNDVKDRLSMLHNRRKVTTSTDPNRPQLRRAPGTGTGPIDDGTAGSSTSDPDERPTLKRRDGGNGGNGGNGNGGNGNVQ
jgi:beta-barrel assembly-enhancing protease